MNFNIGGPSNFSSSSSYSSSDEKEESILAALGAMDVEEEEMIAQYGQFQQAMAQYLNQQNNPVRREYLRSPNATDVARLLRIGKDRGFPGMLGSLDCMHWKWKNCPTAWAGQYAGRSGSPTIILEAVADYDLWI
ncbi:hypothetical protein Ddye_026115 [Dipteronia dyeriana]|uniref:Uncharacterized protein n=1 Tax=Dipteronia dyeriana TaxID=168575 RepID=A0AAD9TMM4_9ROSI|nr:hypothetical protein Ddye_026115 [Dipteronia dyeriana]